MSGGPGAPAERPPPERANVHYARLRRRFNRRWTVREHEHTFQVQRAQQGKVHRAVPPDAPSSTGRCASQVLQLLRTLGNREIGRLLRTRRLADRIASSGNPKLLGHTAVMAMLGARPARRILQRRAARGLQSERRVKEASDRWVGLWRSKQSLTIDQFVQEMASALNLELDKARVPPVEVILGTSGSEGGFRHREWRISINVSVIVKRPVRLDDKVSSLSADDFAALADTFYHEGRHAEQSFLVARARAAKLPDPDALPKTLAIPVDVARAARTAGAPRTTDPAGEEIEEWAAFHPSGRYFDYWIWNESMKKVTPDVLSPVVNKAPKTLDEYTGVAAEINQKINVLSTRWVFPYEKLEEITRRTPLDTVDAGVLAQLRKITASFDKLVLEIDKFRGAVDVMRAVSSSDKPVKEVVEYRKAVADERWFGVKVSLAELVVVQGDAYAN